MACSGRWLTPLIKQMVWGIQRCVCSGGAGTTASSNKICMQCLGSVFLFCGDGWALWIIRSKQDQEFWQTRVTPACTRTPRSGVIHQSQRCWCLKAPDETQPIYRPPHTRTRTPACTLPAHSCKAWNYSCWWWLFLFRQMTHTQHLVNSSLVVSCVPPFFWKTFCSVSHCSSSILFPSWPH